MSFSLKQEKKEKFSTCMIIRYQQKKIKTFICKTNMWTCIFQFTFISSIVRIRSVRILIKTKVSVRKKGRYFITRSFYFACICVYVNVIGVYLNPSGARGKHFFFQASFLQCKSIRLIKNKK